MRLNVIHVSRYAPVVPSLWVDTSGVKPVLKAYVNGRYQTLSEEIPADILTEDMIVNSLDSDAVDMPLSAAQGKILKSLIDGKQDALTPGTGIEITDDNIISVTLDTTVFKVVSSLPDSPASEDMNKIHLVPSENTVENNSYKEYLWVNNEWEEIGTYVSTVDLTPYLTKEDAGKTYQKLTDDSLQTQDKTVVGGINEVNAGLKEVVKPYVINLTGLLAAQDSESISAAIGGIDNLNGTVQKNQVIFGTLANGTVAVGIRVLGNQTTLTYFVDSVGGLTVNEIIITNTSGTLTKTTNTHAVLTENMVVDALDSDENTLPLSAAQGKILSTELEENSGNIQRLDTALDRPTVEKLKPTVIRNNFSINTSGYIGSEQGYYIYAPISLSKGDTLILYSMASASVSIITSIKPGSEQDSLQVISPLLIGGRLDYRYAWTAPYDMTVVFCSGEYGTIFFKDVYLIKSPQGVNMAGLGYHQLLHKIYESYGAVYNTSTGYWELNGLTDLTEEEMCDIYLAGDKLSQSNLWAGAYCRNTVIRTHFTPRYNTDSGVIGSHPINGMFYNCRSLEVAVLSSESSPVYFSQNASYAFYGARKLREIKGILSCALSCVFTNTFTGCPLLNTIKLHGLQNNVSFKDSPLLSYESIKYLVDNAANTDAITVTVHPTTYSYLTGITQPTAEVGGTTDEWQALVTTAQGQQISFAVPEETQSEVTE